MQFHDSQKALVFMFLKIFHLRKKSGDSIPPHLLHKTDASERIDLSCVARTSLS